MSAVSVIIPTTCELSRWQSLLRAIDSLRQQDGVQVRAIVVVNGNRFDAKRYEELKAMPNLEVLYRTEGSAPLARQAGRLAVGTPFFSFLDDDDEYLPDTLRLRLQPLLNDPGLDFTVSNGYRCVKGKDRIVVKVPAPIGEHPLLALGKQNWMASCAGLFRSATVTPEFFRDPAPYVEWTYLAYRLGVARRMHFVDVAAYRIHESTVSLLKTDAYRNAELEVLQRILNLSLAPEVARVIRKKLGRAHHGCAGRDLERGRMGAAWSHHLKSLAYPGGASRLLYSRKLLAAQVLHTLGVGPDEDHSTARASKD
jgi:glycosyltransferase involved in cell wall biosynthesis